MKIEFTINLELDDEQLEAMACVANMGPTNRKVTTKMVMEFWSAYVYRAIEEGKSMNLAYARSNDAGRKAIDEYLAKTKRTDGAKKD